MRNIYNFSWILILAERVGGAGCLGEWISSRRCRGRSIHNTGGGWGVSQTPPNQKLALQIVRHDISTHIEAVCEKVGCCNKSIRLKIYSFVWFLLWLCKSVLLNTLPHRITMLQNPYFFCFFWFKKSLYIPIMSVIHSNSIFMQQLSVFTKYFCKTTWMITWKKL